MSSLRRHKGNPRHELQSGRSQITNDSGREMDSVRSSHGNRSSMQVCDGCGRQKRHTRTAHQTQNQKIRAATHAPPQNTDAPSTKQIRRTAAMSRTVTEIRHNIARNTLMSRMEAEKLWTNVYNRAPKTLLKQTWGWCTAKCPDQSGLEILVTTIQTSLENS